MTKIFLFLSKCGVKCTDLDKNAWFILVEMKFCETPFVIKKDYEEFLKTRKSLFMEITNITRGPVLTFITPMGLSQGSHSSIIHSQLTAKHLFASIL